MRPNLDRNISLKNFQEFYWLKTELINFCRENRISAIGGKKELQKRIVHYISTGERIFSEQRKTRIVNSKNSQITLGTQLKETYKNDTLNREFFKSEIGERFKFNVIFMKWVKQNSHKTYKDAVNEWLRIEEEKKSGKKFKIGSQFEYNQYTRDFFKANPDGTKADAIKCWKYKKGIPGSNRYEKSDLNILNYYDLKGNMHLD